MIMFMTPFENIVEISIPVPSHALSIHAIRQIRLRHYPSIHFDLLLDLLLELFTTAARNCYFLVSDLGSVILLWNTFI